jgi:hypothetical protein
MGAAETGMADDAALALRLASLRERGAEHFQPVRFGYLQGMMARLERFTRPVHANTLARLQTALKAYETDFERVQERAKAARLHRNSPVHSLAPLMQTLQACQSNDVAATHYESAEQATPRSLQARMREQDALWQVGQDLSDLPDTAQSRPDLTPLRSLQRCRDDCVRIAAERWVQQAAELAPENAGPLNSYRLLIRSLQAMDAISPDYLIRFVAYLDAVLWIESAQRVRNTGR